MMKRWITILLAAVLLLGTAALPASAAPTAQSLHTRKDFVWGVNMHRQGWSAYAQATMEDQYHVAAELGTDLVRVNLDLAMGFDYMDDIVGLCNAYGLKVMACVTQGGNDPDMIELMYKSMAGRYDGKHGHGRIDYFQLLNETEIPMLGNKYGSGAPQGVLEENYFQDDMDELLDYFIPASRGVRASGSGAKVVVNMSYYHYGEFFYYIRKGLDFDMIGLDWYSNMGPQDYNSFEDILGQLEKNFDKDIIICETNQWDSRAPKGTAQEDYDNDSGNWSWLIDSMEVCYKHPRVKGLIIYELLDEPALRDSQEGFFGLVTTTGDGKISKPKAVYHDIQKLWNGKTLKKVTLDEYEKYLPAPTVEDPKPIQDPKPAAPSSGTSDPAEKEEKPQREENRKPVKPEKENTSEKDGDDFDWDDDTGEEVPEENAKKIAVTQKIYQFPWAIFIAVSAALVLGCAAAVFFTVRKKKKQ